jgi:imidazolonepropionase-like amidohydrolase
MVASCADILPLMARRGIVPDLLTDQASAHDPLNGYVPNGMTLEEAIARRRSDPDEYLRRSMDVIAMHVRAMLTLKRMGAVGSLEPGKLADFAIFDCRDYREIPYWFGLQHATATYISGRLVHGRRGSE